MPGAPEAGQAWAYRDWPGPGVELMLESTVMSSAPFTFFPHREVSLLVLGCLGLGEVPWGEY